MAADQIVIRQARSDDMIAIVAMFASDVVGGHGDSSEPALEPTYRAAFDWIDASPDNTLWVAEQGGEVVGTYQTTFVRSLTGRGASSLIIEAVHTRHDQRGSGIGAVMMNHAITQGRQLGVRLVQLSSNVARKDAHRFYQRLGFVQSHLGFKMKLG